MGQCMEHGPIARSLALLPRLDPPPALPGFVATKLLGTGGFATVYLAEQTGVGPCALKVAHSDDVSRQVLQHERRALERIGPPAVPAIRGTGTNALGQAYLAMDYIPGPTLAEVMLEEPNDLDLVRLRAIVLPILRVLGIVHRSRFIHGDLKPENIILGGAEGATLIDLGLAGEIPSNSPQELTAGTVEYMSPEQCTTGEYLDQRSDIYALGVLVVELITHRPLFWGQAEQIREAHRSQRIPSLPLALPLLRFVHRCLAKDRERRPSTLEAFEEEFITALAACESGLLLGRVPAASPPPEAEVQGARKETIGLVWFVCSSPPIVLRRALEPTQGQIVHVHGPLHVAGFIDAGRDHPVRAALTAAETIVENGYTTRVLVDIAEVRIRSRPNGPPRVTSPRFLERDGYPNDADPLGVLVTDAAKSLLPDVPFRATDRTGIWNVDSEGSTQEWQLDRVSRSSFGRHGELATLLRSVDVAMQGKPSLVTVEGPRGIGKSHLAQELAQQLREHETPIRVIAVRVSEPLGRVGRRTTSNLFEGLLAAESKLPPHVTDRIEAAFGSAFVDAYGLGIAIALDRLDDTDPRLDKLKAAPGALRATATVAVGEAIRRTAAKTPLAIVLDDAQFADEILLGAIEYATRREHDLPVFVAVFVQPSFTAGASRSAWGSGAGVQERLSLGPLDEPSAAALVRHLLAPATGVPQWAVANIVERTQASPLLLCELVEGLKRGGCVRRLKRGTGWYLATDALDDIPHLPLVDWLAGREIEQMPADLCQFGGLAAIMGAEFTVDDLQAVNEAIGRSTGRVASDLDPSVGIRKLQRTGVIDAMDDDAMHDGYRFRHEVLRQRLNGLVPEERRREWHRAAHEYFEQSPGMDEVSRKTRLAHHAALAGMAHAAFRHQLELARIAVARHTYLQAERHFAAALEHCDLAEDRLEALHGLGLMRYRIGVYDAASAALEEALPLARSLGLRAREVELLLDSAAVLDWREDYDLSGALVEQAERLADSLTSPILEARLTLGRARSAFRRHLDSVVICDLAVSAAQQASALGPEGYETAVAGLIIAAPLYAYRGDNERAQTMFEQLLRLCEEYNDVMHLTSTYNNRAVLWWEMRDESRLISDIEHVLSLSQTYGFGLFESIALSNLAEVHYALANYESCIRFASLAVEVAERQSVGGRRVLCSLLLLSRCRWVMGDRDEAERLFRKIREIQHQARVEGRSDTELPPGEELLCHAIELSLRHGSEEAWEALLIRAQSTTVRSDEVEVIELRGLASLRAGDPATAARIFASAADQARSASALIEGRIRTRLA